MHLILEPATAPPEKPLSMSKKATVGELYESLPYGPAPESPSAAVAWLEDHGRSFGHFIDNKWVEPEGRDCYETRNPATGETLASTVQGMYVFMYVCM